MFPKSSVGKCIFVMLQDGRGHSLIPMASYFDMSGKLEDTPWLVLAGIAADDSVWAKFSKEWDAILKAHPLKPRYIHMREAVHRQGEFDWRKGWTDQMVQDLVGQFLMLLSHADKKRLKMSYCAIDMDAYRRLKKLGVSLLDPLEICNLNCPEIVLNWYVVKWPGVIDCAHFFFDIGEPFKTPFEEKWTKMINQVVDSIAEKEFWQLIKTVTTIGDKEGNPPIQAVDVLAYGLYRNLSAASGKPYQNMANIVLQCIPSIGNVWDEQTLRVNYENK